jgi:sugar fermentation stimulation protein A
MIYKYPALLSGILLKRYKRFLADIELISGEIITAHCANTGPMTGLCEIGSEVQVSQSDNPKRKLPYTWEMIKINDTWVGVNTNIPNKVIKLALENKIFPELSPYYTTVKSEVPYGENKKSRIDFLLTDNHQKPIYLEVKSTTLAENNLAIFPDTVTTRGQKHLKELMNLIPHCRCVMLYFINRADCDLFSPGDRPDPEYGKLLRQAIKKGVEVLPYRFDITPQGITYLGMAKLAISDL